MQSKQTPELNATEQTHGWKWRPTLAAHTTKGGLSNNDNSTKDFVRRASVEKRLYIQPTISQEFAFIKFFYHCQRCFKQDMYDRVKIRKQNFKNWP